MELNAEVLNGYRERFLRRMPDFADFTVREGTYWTKEREYKEEISARCKALLPASLFEEADTSLAATVDTAVRQILTGKLHSIERPQNIVGWREAAAMRAWSTEGKEIFAESLGDILYSTATPGEKIDRFNSRMWPVFKGGEKANPFARSRTLPTFFLMMVHPEDHVTVRTDLFDDVSMDLLDQSILDNQVFTGAEYLEILDLCRTVRGHLERWGWCPMDMIDVHSFLWTACWDYDESSDSNEETN